LRCVPQDQRSRRCAGPRRHLRLDILQQLLILALGGAIGQQCEEPPAEQQRHVGRRIGPVKCSPQFLGGWIGAFALFGLSTLATRLPVLAFSASDAARTMASAPWLPHTLAYVGVTALACLGYGAVFMAVGVARVNPIIPTLVLFGWESINIFLPAILKQISVVYYLTSLCPVPLDLGPVAIISAPVPALVALLGLAAVTAALLAWSMRRARRLEVDYGEE
jgi:hypothetical protein